MALGSMNTCQVLLLILAQFLAMTNYVEPSNQQCVASSCGDIRNISYPFQLKSVPKGCGDSYHKLACENNHTIRYILDSRFYVVSINYSTRQVRYVDDGLQKDNCSSLPRNALLGNRLNSTYYNQSTLVIVNCSKPISSPFYIATSPCIKGSYSSNTSSNWSLYALLNPKASDLRDFCNISRWTWTDYFGVGEHINSSFYNYELIHSIMANGFVGRYHVHVPEKKTFFCYFDLYGSFHFYNHFYSRRLFNSYTGG
ncbi:uncharacterized protein LOC115668651 [Syzygium oleosum]|uniref:uncharacterized protein LOC115668651 n=1 Tax=Syzygium oleosum TaxID=219896 RepID=UPI0011D25197|nr:uncharacterized protein LOC115668651 [Syzygium oleosum]